MKVIDNLKNILIQEFEHYLESRLIEVMNMKISPSQFVLRVNLIQIQSTQVAQVFSQSQTCQLADASSER
jgi:hypothetical protein